MPQMAPECRHDCQFLSARLQQIKAEHSLALTEGRAMTQALWCDQHDGPFSAKDRGQRTVTSDAQDDEGNTIREQYTMCGPCAAGFRVGGSKVLPASGSIPTESTAPAAPGGGTLGHDLP